MIHQVLLEELQRVARRYRRLFHATALAVVWLVSALIGSCLLAWGWRSGWTSIWTAPLLAAGTFTASGLVLWVGLRRTRDPRWVARKIEAKHPELETMLLAAVEQEPTAAGGEFGFLQTTVIRNTLRHHQRNNWLHDVPIQRILAAQLAGLTAFALLLLVFGALDIHARQRIAKVGRFATDDATVSSPQYEIDVAPGDTEIERGASLVITARFPDQVADAATLLCVDDAGEHATLPMSRSLSDPMFGARVADVQTDFSYAILYGDQRTSEFRVSVFEFPELDRADVDLAFPAYTGLEPKRVDDTRRITAVEGTELTLTCQLNKVVENALLVDKEGQAIALKPSSGDPTVYTVTRTLDASGRYRLELTDAQGRENKDPPEFLFNVTPNRRPDLKITAPAKDLRVSPIEELYTQASVWDDFGVAAYGINYTLPGHPAEDVTLGSVDLHNQRQEFEHVIAFEALQAEPDQLLAYHFWAEDVGPDGQPRRTLGDMYFAEVRHFEEIFRQGEQPPDGEGQQPQGQEQQGGQNAQQAEELAELQKQIINATWTVIRRESAAQPTKAFAVDVSELQAGQSQALQKMSELAEQLEDAQSKQHAAAVVGHMTDAIGHLTEADQASSPDALVPAMAAEQQAYQALLKLRAREHEVVRSNPQQSQQRQSGSASGQQSRAQQQLEQLELDDEQNRYETQQQASAPPQQEQQRETLQVLNRLRELARRQADLNKRLQELQTALDAAETEEERDEIQEQLKRLREQQQQMLRDVDELAERMEQPQNQEQMSEASRNLEQTRENIRQSTEALQEGQISKAVASGTRAERELEEMREEFRKAAANRFADDVEQLRDEARELHENEQELSQQLEELDQPKPQSPGLREDDNRQEARDALQRQQEDLRQLLEKMQETVEEAEEAEPLMAGQLYDSIRQARQEHIEDALDATAQLMDRGLDDQARMAESHAADGIERLQEGVEKAADSVLGDEQAALRRAQQTLDELARELDEEMRRATGQAAQDNASPTDEPPGQQPRQGQPASPSPDGEQQDGQQQQGQQQQGQPQQGQAQQGQAQQGQAQQGQAAGSPADGQPSQPQQASESPQPSRQPGQMSPTQRPQNGGGNQAATGPAGMERFRGPVGPITGEFVPWADQLRDVEEMIDDPAMRAEAARIRDAARGIRRDMHENFQGPNWDLVRERVSEPLNELRNHVAEELLRREPNEALVPIDRDPVPPEFADQVRRYYEQLGSGL